MWAAIKGDGDALTRPFSRKCQGIRGNLGFYFGNRALMEGKQEA